MTSGVAKRTDPFTRAGQHGSALREPASHGGDGRAVAESLGIDPNQVLDLSFSCNPFGPDVASIITRHVEAGALGRYPDALDMERATAAMAEVLGVERERVLLTNGGSEAIALVASELEVGWVEEPDFSLYRRHIRVLDHTGPTFRSDPNNPTGQLAPSDAVAQVWDEAFYPLATGVWSRSRQLGDLGVRGTPRSLFVVLGSLTKVLGCPGLRIGYVVVPEDDGESLGRPGLAAILAERQPQWSVSTVALVALPELLAKSDLPRWSAQIAVARSELIEVLRRYGLEPRPSDANFLLVDNSPALRTRLALQGVVVRDCTSFGLSDSVRVAVPDAHGLERLDAALARCELGEPRGVAL